MRNRLGPIFFQRTVGYNELDGFFLENENPDLWMSAKFKGTVRPDWICMRLVSLESPLKGHQPLYVFNFLFLILNI
jgi:hypothetical protein